MGFFDSIFNPGKGYKKGQEQLDKYYQQGQGYLNPYNQQGQQAFQPTFDAMKNLLDPQALQDKWSSGYETSQAAKDSMGLAQQHGLDAASGMGLMGSSAGLDAIQAGTSQIGAQDKQQYMNDLMQKYTAGTGIGQNIYGQGANAAGQMSQNANQMGQNSADMAYGQQNANGNMWRSGLGAAAGLAGSALGGPIGGTIANQMANHWNTGGGK